MLLINKKYPASTNSYQQEDLVANFMFIKKMTILVYYCILPVLTFLESTNIC